MRFPTRSARGFTRTELVVAVGILAVLAILVSLAVPAGTDLAKRQLIRDMNNERQIHLATISTLGWPGDLKANGRISTLSDYINLLVRTGCFKPSDLKIFCGPGYKPYEGTLSSGSDGILVPPFTDENCALKIYLVKDADSSNTVFLASKNGDNGFFVIRKGGDAGIFKKAQGQNFQLPGGGTVESAANCLNPGQ